MDNSLKHYGVLGMKWGKRKNKGQRELSIKEKSKVMSDEQLKSTINRLRMEKQYIELNTPKRTFGKKVVEGVLLTHGQKTLGIAIGVATTYGIKYIKKKMTGG